MDDGGKIGAVTRGRDAPPLFRAQYGGIFRPRRSRVCGCPDVPVPDNGGELDAVA